MKFAATQTIVLSTLLTLITQIIPTSPSVTITSEITYNGVLTISLVENVLCVPPGARLLLNCTSSPDVEWDTSSTKYPFITSHPAGATALINPFSSANSGSYTCSSNGEEQVITVTADEIAIVPNPQRYEVLDDASVTLTACVSAYPSLQSSLVLSWSKEGLDITACSSQGSIGCFECEVSVSDQYSVTNFLFEATSQGSSTEEELTIIVHVLTQLVTPLSLTTDVLECSSASLSCEVTGDPDVPVEWKYYSSGTQTTLSSGSDYTIITNTSYSSVDMAHYTYSSLIIKLVGVDTGGQYSCVFQAYGDTVTSSTQVQVTPQLCIQRFKAGDVVFTPGNSVTLLQGSPHYVYLCIGDKVKWYQGDTLLSEETNADISQAISSGFATMTLAITPQPDFFYCRSGVSSLETWIYLTAIHPTVITIPSGILYYLIGSNVTINTYISPPQSSFTLSWSYAINGTQRDVTELGWSVTEENEYYSISLIDLEDRHSGNILVEYTTQGQITTSMISVMTLPTPDLELSHQSNLFLWEGSWLQVECLLKNESIPVTVSPEWVGVSSCPSEVCSDNSSLSLYNITTSVSGNYSCRAGNEAGGKQTSLSLHVMSFSDDLISLSFKLSLLSLYTQADTLLLTASNTSTQSLLLSCSLNNSIFSTDYLHVSDPVWLYNTTLSHAVTIITSEYLSVDLQSIFYQNQESLFTSLFCCETTLDLYRTATQCIHVTFDSDITYPPPPPPTSSHLSILLFVDNCTLLPSPDLLTPLQDALLDLIRTNCSCNISDTELQLTEHYCHTDYISNHPAAILTLCGASTDNTYQLLLTASMLRQHITIQEHSLNITSVRSEYEGTYCFLTTTTEYNITTPTPLSNTDLPIWGKIVLFGALPMLVFMLTLLFICIFTYLCCSNVTKAKIRDDYTVQSSIGGQKDVLTEHTDQSGEQLTSSIMTFSPSLVPQTFKSATNRLYQPMSPQELLCRPASTPPSQGEFPIMYSNPLAFDGSGEGYTTSFTNFNDNHTYCSDMPPISETAHRMAPVYSTHRLHLNPNHSYFARDQAHSSLPSPLRHARRNHPVQHKLSQYRNRSVTPTNPYLQHQLKMSYRPPSTMRTETPTFDSGVEELDSINPRSSSSASSQASDELAPPRARSTSLATSFPQHARHLRMHSIEIPKNTSLPNITEAGVDKFNSQGLELYKTVKKGQRESQTLV